MKPEEVEVGMEVIYNGEEAVVVAKLMYSCFIKRIGLTRVKYGQIERKEQEAASDAGRLENGKSGSRPVKKSTRTRTADGMATKTPNRKK